MSKRGHEEEVQFDLGKKKKVTIRSFKGTPLVDIREYYTPKGDDKELPGKKGISLTLDVWRELVKSIPEIQKALGELTEEEEEPPKKTAKVEKAGKAKKESKDDDDEEEEKDAEKDEEEDEE
ncbi:hypothetical protein TRVA0_019S00804 [Trichomonascus vanleenenianus]|uniref:chromatin-binding transcription coactivator SUB1 n=1 Tax=Trichomonascus vanleenenianus TaxID=2268995 RepID=UPI003ECA5AC9